MKNVQNYDEEAYELDNVYNEDDLYEDWYNNRDAAYTDDTFYPTSVDETSIWYN